jgi:hypothetical protein
VIRVLALFGVVALIGGYTAAVRIMTRARVDFEVSRAKALLDEARKVRRQVATRKAEINTELRAVLDADDEDVPFLTESQRAAIEKIVATPQREEP